MVERVDEELFTGHKKFVTFYVNTFGPLGRFQEVDTKGTKKNRTREATEDCLCQ